jgi:hypothetical protein
MTVMMMPPDAAEVTGQERGHGVRCSYDVKARVLISAVLAVAGAVFAAVPAAAKDGVHATLTTKVPLDAEPGTTLRIGWRLAYVEEGEPHPFGASGVFVRLSSAAGAASHTGFAAGDGGTFSAIVAVPEGGIGDIQIGLRGYTSGVRSGPGDLLFPITNDPLPGKPRAASAPPAPAALDEADGGARAWLVVVAGFLLALTAAAAAVQRRRSGRSYEDVTEPPGPTSRP